MGELSGSSNPGSAIPQGLRDLKVGQKIGRFKVRGKLGRGSAGWVVRAEDTTLKRPVALKLLAFESQRDKSHREAAEAFLAEARRAAQLVHPGIVQILEIGRTNQLVFIAMELLEGGTLEQKAKEEGTLPWRRAVEWIIEACGPLGYAHSQGVIHRDVKPANLMLTATGHVKVMDFGLAYAEKAAEAEAANQRIASPEGAVAGTPYFMAPEVLRSQASPRSDVFALAGSLWHLLTGSPPFDIRELTDVGKIGGALPLGDFSEARPDVPAPIGRVLGEALDPDPEQRPADAQAFGDALRKAVNEVDIPVARPARQAPPPPAAAGHRRTIVLAAAIALGLGAGIAITAAFIFGPFGGADQPNAGYQDPSPTPPTSDAAGPDHASTDSNHADGETSQSPAGDGSSPVSSGGERPGDAPSDGGDEDGATPADENKAPPSGDEADGGSSESAGEAPDGGPRDDAEAPDAPADATATATATAEEPPESPTNEGEGAEHDPTKQAGAPGEADEREDGQTADDDADADAEQTDEASEPPGLSLPTPPPDHPVMTLSVGEAMERLTEYAKAGNPHRFAVHGRVAEGVTLGEAGGGVFWLATGDEPRAVAVRLPAASTETVLKQLALPEAEDLAGRRVMIDGTLSWSEQWAAPVVEVAAIDRLRRIDPVGEGVIDAHAGGALLWAALKGETIELHGRIKATRLRDKDRVAVWELATRETGPAVRIRFSRRLFEQAEQAVGKPTGAITEGRFVIVRGKPEYLLRPDAVLIRADRIQSPDRRQADLASNAAVVQTTDDQQIQALLNRADRNRYAFRGRVTGRPAIVQDRGMIIMLGRANHRVVVEAPRSTIEAMQDRFGGRAEKLEERVIQVIGVIEQPRGSVPTIKIESAAQVRVIKRDGG